MSQQERKHRRRIKLYKKAMKHFWRFIIKQDLKNGIYELQDLDIFKCFRRRTKYNCYFGEKNVK